MLFNFIQPTLIRVSGRSDVKQEIFGPVLHVAKFSPEALPDIVEEINSADYALTFGLHTRIDSRVDEITQSLKTGNIYVNRNQIGAVVGSQPFGGSGLSGTGPKAGGPDYLSRFYKTKIINKSYVESENPLTLLGVQSKIDAAPLPSLKVVDVMDCPGPTGESNRLSKFVRGRTLCLGPDIEKQIHLVDKAGGVGVACPDISVEYLERLIGFSSVICWGEAAMLAEIRQALARREGPILPLMTGEDVHWAILAEQHICIDTTASGGNTELLSGGY